MHVLSFWDCDSILGVYLMVENNELQVIRYVLG